MSKKASSENSKLSEKKIGSINESKSGKEESAKLSSFPVVGIGASAGGLEALKMLLENLPSDTGLAFVIVQHLAAGQVSMLTEILSRSTGMPVHKVEDGEKVEPNNVYVIPPDNSMTIVNDVLELHPRVSNLRPVDAFLASLAVERKVQAIGIVLSGTGADGTEGLKAIKAEGGITFVQDPETAQYQGMPLSAIAAETAYFILPPDKIAKEIVRIAKHPQIIRAEIEAAKPKATKEDYDKAVFAMLKSAFGVDFAHYKESTVSRRITRRMVINQIDNLKNYTEFLREHPKELQALFDDMLIGVTSFFREPNTFEIMKAKVYPEILKDRTHEAPIRIWVPGCSTGEEVYSIAITLHEFLEEKKTSDLQIQIFGTDVNDRNIEKSRQAIYAKNIEAYVSEKLLKKYFLKVNGNYQIAKFIRDMCIFAKQDITKDPPFSNLDMICCRNVLIYFDPFLQEKIIPILHYALKPNGFLILGESESVGKFTDLFAPMEKKGIMYIKKRAPSIVTFGFEAFPPVARTAQRLKEFERGDPMAGLRDEIDRIVMSRYAPAMILVNKDLDILIFQGYMAPYILPQSGEASLNVNKMLRDELRLEIQTAIYRAKKENKHVTLEGVVFKANGDTKALNIEIMPVRPEKFEETFYLILFVETPKAPHPEIQLARMHEKGKLNKDQQLRDVREELESTKQSLQTIIEEQEATNEELRAAMEEVQSSNEELQSTNEELETAKEELQSSNEELKTLNDELKNRNADLARLNDDLSNLIKNIDTALIMVDGSLKIRKFTPLAEDNLGLITTDVGRSITNIRLNIAVKQLDKMITEVITNLHAVKREVQDQNGRWYELRIRPYITEEKRIDGAVITFIDIDEIKKLEGTLRDHSEHLEELVQEKTGELQKAERLAAIGETAGMVGHDIRNPLQTITGSVFLATEEIKNLPEGEPKKSLQESLTQIEQQTEYINKIVSDLQDYARPLCPEIKAQTLQSLIKDALSTIKIPENIQVTTQINKNLPKIQTDAAYLTRTLANLIVNSVQAMPNGGQITITGQQLDHDKIQLDVQDTGLGIPKGLKDKIFKPLVTTKAKGQGFGLAVCKRLMDAQNSTITYESTEGKGTTFSIQLPTA